jgi:hypothetical protein
MSEVERGGMRAGHADREQVVGRLNAAFAEGRLDVTELDDRVARAYAAKTLGELVPLTADLPAEQQQQFRPAAPAARTGGPVARRDERFLPVAGMVGVFLLNVVIWAVVSLARGDVAYFWPVWLLIPVAVTVLGALGRRGS